jgi:hypothetical protein
MTPISLAPLIASILVKATLLVGVAAVADVVLRRHTSAAARHLLWTLTVVALLLLPPLTIALPGWSLPFRLPDAVNVMMSAQTAPLGAPAVPLAAANPSAVARTARPATGESSAAVASSLAPGRAAGAAQPAAGMALREEAQHAAAAGSSIRDDVRTRWVALLVIAYAVGALVLFARLGWQRAIVRRLVRQAVDVPGGEWGVRCGCFVAGSERCR